MKSVINKTAMKVTALTVALLIALSCTLNMVFAAAGSEGSTVYGTEADGITGDALSVTPLETFENGGFEKGLKYWGGYNNKGMSNENVTVQNDGENSYLEVNNDNSNKRFYGVKSVKFKIDDLSAGDEVYVYFDYRVKMNAGNESGQRVFWSKLSTEGDSTGFSANAEFFTPAYTDIAKWTRGSYSGTLSKVSETGENLFYITFAINWNVAAKINVDNIVIAVRHNSGDSVTPEGYFDLLDGTCVTELELNPNMYGTFEDGLGSDAKAVKPFDALMNGNFEDGLKFWGNQKGSGFASNAASVKTESGNSYIEMDRDNAENAALGVNSVPFKVSNLSVGDELYIFFDYKLEMYGANTAGTAFYAYLNPLDKSETGFYTDNLRIGITPNNVSKWTMASASAKVKTIPADGTGVYYISIYLQYKAAARVDIDNVVVAVRRNSGDNITPDGCYDLLDGTRVTELELNPAIYGSAEDGISGDAKALTPIDTLKNGDFEEGLKFWGNQTGNGFASNAASVKTESGNSYIEIDRDNAENAPLGVRSVPFKIKNLNAGDEIFLFFDYRLKVYDSNIASTSFYAYVTPLDKTTTAFNVKDFRVDITPSNAEKWVTAFAGAKVETLPANGEGVYYLNLYLQYKAAAKIDIDNVVVAVRRNSGSSKTPDGYYELLDGTRVTDADLNPGMYGTADEGVRGNALSLTPLNTFKNGDFEDGLKYWGSYNKKSMSLEGASVKTENDNSYLEINRETGDEKAAHGIISVPFKISGLSAGDEVYAYFDYRVRMNEANVSGQRVLWSRMWTGNDSTEFSANAEYFTPAKTNVAKWTRASLKGTLNKTAENGDGVFYVSFTVNYCVAARIDLDNIVIAVRRNSGSNKTPDGCFELLDGTCVTELELNPNMYGTADDGAAGNVLELKPLNALLNGDFEDGLKYWGNQSKSGLASTAAATETVNGNTYMVIDRKEPENAAQGVITVPFTISNLQKGDVVTVTYDYKVEKYSNSIAGTDFYVNFLTTDKEGFKLTDGNNSLRLSGQKPLENKYVTAAAGWNTAAGQMIVDKAGENTAFYIQVYLQYKAACKLYFDNFKVYVRHNSGANKTPGGYYETLDGKLVSEKLFDGCTVSTGTNDVASGANDTNYPGIVYSWIGTEENGIYSEKENLCNKFPVRTKYMNADFSKGLQYWFESRSTGYTSQNVTLKTEKNGNRYVTVGENGTSYQLNQTHFWLESFEPGDKVYIMVKFRKYGQFGCNGYVRNAVDSPALSLTRAHGTTKVVYEPESDDDWGIAISSAYITIPHLDQIDPKASDIFGGKIAYYMMINGSKEADISAIMLVRKNADGTYTDSDGNLITVPKNTNNYHYSSADGFDWSNSKLTDAYGTGKQQGGVNLSVKQPVGSEKSTDKTVLTVALIAAGFALLAGAGVIIGITVKKQKIKKQTMK